jgi:predicted dehydrogenase
MKKLRVGMIGYKFMGKAHSNAWYKVNKFFSPGAQVEMAAICGRTKDAVQQVADNWGWESVETDWRALVKRDDIDIVDIGTPNNSHAEIAIGAAESGKHVICEKPLAMDLDEARQMRDAARKAKVANMVWYNYRRVPAVNLAKQIVEEGRLGRIFHVRAVYLQDWIIDPEFPLVWRLRKEVAGSGAHGDLNAHIIDAARFITGDEFDEVVGHAQTFIKERPIGEMAGGLSAGGEGAGKMGEVTVDDAVIFLARFKSGAIGTFEATRFAQGRKNGNRIEINGEKGSLVFEFERMNELQFLSAEDPPHLQGFRTILATTPGEHQYYDAWWPPGHIIGYEHTFINQANDFVQAIAQGQRASPDFADACKTQAVLDAVLESAEKRAWVSVPEA